MDRAEIFDLLIEIKENYPHFDVSEENVDRHMKYLHDFSFEAAQQNLQEHVRTGKWAPNIAEIRGQLGEQLERNRMRAVTAEFFAKREAAAEVACPPPPGWKDGLIERLRHRK
ncbi:replicative helicase loader/inhibitor [Paenibacillus sp. FSL k6-2145]|uniref:replicative helicase loader/inhibitor n=1 Tax=Paenibacillus sp. FSL k6-2145 TaxID=2976834 RepID=UPI0030DA14D2